MNEPMNWGAWGGGLMFSIAMMGRYHQVEMPVGIATASPVALCFMGFFWGAVLCIARNRLGRA